MVANLLYAMVVEGSVPPETEKLNEVCERPMINLSDSLLICSLLMFMLPEGHVNCGILVDA